MQKLYPAAELSGRILLALLFLLAGINKLMDYDATIQYMANGGVPGFLLPVVIGFQILAALGVMAGYQTRLLAVALAGYCLLTGVMFHLQPGDQLQTALLLKNLSIAGGFLVLMVHGAGPLSLDAKRRQ